MTYRLLTWNILEGLLERNADATGFRPDGHRPMSEQRLGAMRDVLGMVKPDILVLNEALYCETFEDRRIDYADLFGYEFSSAHLYDGAWGNVILSRYPIFEQRWSLIHRQTLTQNRSSLAARVAMPEGPLWVVTHHPHPARRPFKRAEDFDEFLTEIRGEAILAGDLNAINPADRPDRATLITAFEGFMTPEKAVWSVDHMIEAGRHLFEDVLPKLGMRDLSTLQRPTIPTALLPGGKASAMRIDHVIGTGGIQVLHAAPIENALTDQASDHYPVLLEFDFAPFKPSDDADRRRGGRRATDQGDGHGR